MTKRVYYRKGSQEREMEHKERRDLVAKLEAGHHSVALCRSVEMRTRRGRRKSLRKPQMTSRFMMPQGTGWNSHKDILRWPNMRRVWYQPLVSGSRDIMKLMLLVQKLVLPVDKFHDGNGAAAPGHVYLSFSCLPGDCSKNGEHLSCKVHFGSNMK